MPHLGQRYTHFGGKVVVEYNPFSAIPGWDVIDYRIGTIQWFRTLVQAERYVAGLI